MTATRRLACAVLLVASLCSACARGTPDIDVGDARAATPVAGSSQVVVSVTNSGDGADELQSASTPAAFDVEFHETRIEGGRAEMRSLESVEIPADTTVAFRPGDLHVMLVVPDDTVVEGGTFELTLAFERSGEVTVPVEVVDLADLADSAFEAPA